MYQFSMAAVTNCYKLGGLKQEKKKLQSYRSGGQKLDMGVSELNQGVGRTNFLLETLEESLFP